MPEMIPLLKDIVHTFKKEGKSFLGVESPNSKKDSKNKKKKKATKPKEGVPKKKKEAALKDTSFHYGKDGH